MKFIRANCDYADEFCCEAFAIVTPDKLKQMQDTVKTYFDKQYAEWDKKHPNPKYAWERDRAIEYESYFGTNEALTFTSYADWYDSFTIVDINQDQIDTILSFFELTNKDLKRKGIVHWGTGSSAIFELSELINGVDEDEDSDEVE